MGTHAGDSLLPDQNCLIIDDTAGALRMMSGFGAATLKAPCDLVREAVYRFALKRRWEIVNYDTYANWALGELQASGAEWIVLDPLFRIPPTLDRVRAATVYRQLNSTVAPTQLAAGAWPRASDSFGFGVLDDAASSGRTLESVILQARREHSMVSEVLVCASSRGALDRVKSLRPVPRWRSYLLGDWRVIHLRDGCPYLPFSGRPIEQAKVALEDGIRVELRSSSAQIPGNLWQVLWLDSGLRKAVSNAVTQVVTAMTDCLNRQVCVADLPMLGHGVAAFVNRNERTVNGSTLLKDLTPLG